MAEAEGATIDPDRLARISTLTAGAQDGATDALCALEAVAYIVREPPSDRPACASPSIAALVRAWNDGLPQPDRDALILPLVPRLVGTRGSDAIERRRIAMAADWLVRTHLPAWFHLAKLHIEAEAFEDLPEFAHPADVAALCDHLKGARRRAAVADLTLRQTGPAVRAAAWDATHQAAWETVRDSLEAVGPAVLAAGWDAAYAAAYAAARAWGKAPLEPTRRALQRSAVALVERMIDAGERDPGDGAGRAPNAPEQRPGEGSPPHPAGHGPDVRP